VQRLVEAAIVVLVFGVIAAFGAWRSGYLRRTPATRQLLVGLTVGLVSALVILVAEAHPIPDSLEGALEPIFLIAVTPFAIVGSVARLAGR
jgi:predicted MFS family arabinose efflux permease